MKEDVGFKHYETRSGAYHLLYRTRKRWAKTAPLGLTVSYWPPAMKWKPAFIGEYTYEYRWAVLQRKNEWPIPAADPIGERWRRLKQQ